VNQETAVNSFQRRGAATQRKNLDCKRTALTQRTPRNAEAQRTT
jgi:hypothetical protein